MSNTISPPEYLGDSVYAQGDAGFPGSLVLTTDSHLMDDAGNTIILEPEVVLAFLRYVKRHHAEYLKHV